MKEHPRLTLGEDFAQEKSWQWEDITVLIPQAEQLFKPQTGNVGVQGGHSLT